MYFWIERAFERSCWAQLRLSPFSFYTCDSARANSVAARLGDPERDWERLVSSRRVIDAESKGLDQVDLCATAYDIALG